MLVFNKRNKIHQLQRSKGQGNCYHPAQMLLDMGHPSSDNKEKFDE